MPSLDQFEYFCRVHHHQPDFRQRLAERYRGDLLSGSRACAKPPLIWLEANACSGDSISVLNATAPDLGQILCTLTEVRYWSAIMPDQGVRAREQLFQTADEGGFILMVEGAIAFAGQGRFAIPFKTEQEFFTAPELIRYLAPKARYILAVGTCAAFGGPSAAHPNLSDSKGVWEVIQDRPVINVSGCPVHPDWLTGTLFHLLLFGLPEVDRYQRPTLFYGRTIHERCQRRSHYDTGSFAAAPGDPECMLAVGCMGPVTGADCPVRLWNDRLNWPVKANTPCIGCTKAGFPDKSMPFNKPLEQKIPRRKLSLQGGTPHENNV